MRNTLIKAQSGIGVLLTEINPSLATSVRRAPSEPWWARTLCEKPAGRNREVWTGQASRLSLYCDKNKTKNKTKCEQQGPQCAWGYPWVACDKCGLRHRRDQHKAFCVAQGSTCAFRGDRRAEAVGTASMNTHARTSEATGMGGECPRALVTTFEWCSLATCYLASCRCSGKVTCFKLHSFLFSILLVGVTDRAEASAERETKFKTQCETVLLIVNQRKFVGRGCSPWGLMMEHNLWLCRFVRHSYW